MSSILDFLVITCLTDSPDIYFLSFGQQDSKVHFADIDETETTPLSAENDKTHLLEYDRRYGSLFQVVSGLS
jgi:hypothetical protein